MYSYSLHILKTDKRNKKIEEFEFKVSNSFTTIKSCYSDAVSLVYTLGDYSIKYDWFNMVGSLLYEELSLYQKCHKFKSMSRETSVYSVEVVMSVNVI